MKDANFFHVAIEGPDGVGKTEISRQVCELIKEKYPYTRLTHEPHESYDDFSLIEKFITGNRAELGGKLVDNERVSQLFYENRRSMLEDIEAKDEIDILISDRSALSSMVHQRGPGLKMKAIAKLNMNYLPDFILLLSTPNHVRLRRIRSRLNNERVDYLDPYADRLYRKAAHLLKRKYNIDFKELLSNDPMEHVVFSAVMIIERAFESWREQDG